MADLIDRRELLERIEKTVCKYCDDGSAKCMGCALDGAIFIINAQEAVESKKGEWIDFNPSDPLDPRMKCSRCGGVELPKTTWIFCPICGADMRGANEQQSG